MGPMMLHFSNIGGLWGFRALGLRALGFRALGLRALAFRALGFKALGFRASVESERSVTVNETHWCEQRNCLCVQCYGGWVLCLNRECDSTIKLLDPELLNSKPLNPHP